MLSRSFNYKNYGVCNLEVSLYPYSKNKNAALLLVENTGAVVAKITFNPMFEFPNTHVCIKNYSENEGMLNFALENNIIIKDTLINKENNCYKMADDIYEEYLKILKDYKQNEL